MAWTFTSFHKATGFMRHFLRTPVSVSPNLPAVQVIGSKRALQPSAPVVAWRAPLRAPRFTVLAQAGGLGCGASAPVKESVRGLAALCTRKCERLGRPRDTPSLTPHSAAHRNLFILTHKKSY